MTIQRGNLFTGEPPAQGEHFATIARLGPAWVECIVSSNQPGLDPYDQAQDEWVALLVGEATLEVAGEALTLRPGDYVFLPAHTAHRVLATTQGARWLAVHCKHSGEPKTALRRD